MYSKEALSEIFQRILQFEHDAKSSYDDCINKVDDEHSINILQSIRDEETAHIEEAKKLFEIIEEDFPRTKDAEDLPKEASSK
jgi:bacterioferritin (cytochrome b1)